MLGEPIDVLGPEDCCLPLTRHDPLAIGLAFGAAGSPTGIKSPRTRLASKAVPTAASGAVRTQ